MNRYSLSVIILAMSLNSGTMLGSDCRQVAKKELYQYSDLIFIGEFVREYDSSYLLKIHEIFKGKTDSTLAIDKAHSPLLERSKFWLVYANSHQGDIIIWPCSGTKSFEMPFGIHDLHRIKMPPEQVTENQTLNYLYDSDLLFGSLNELQLDIISLRQFKSEDQINSWILGNQMVDAQYSELKYQNNLLMGIVIFLTGLVIAFGVVLYRK